MPGTQTRTQKKKKNRQAGRQEIKNRKTKPKSNPDFFMRQYEWRKKIDRMQEHARAFKRTRLLLLHERNNTNKTERHPGINDEEKRKRVERKEKRNNKAKTIVLKAVMKSTGFCLLHGQDGNVLPHGLPSRFLLPSTSRRQVSALPLSRPPLGKNTHTKTQSRR